MSDIPKPDEIEATRQKAENGDIYAQRDLASWYLNGLGLEKDSERAAYWFRQAANAGDTHACYMLAFRYDRGDGVEQDDVQALHWFEKSATDGGRYALYQVGRAYFLGKGTEINLPKAAECFKKSAEAEHTGACYYYGLCLVKGLGVPQDINLGLSYIEKAAKDDNEEAQLFLNEFNTTPPEKVMSYDDAIAELESLVGLDEVKHQVLRLLNRIKLRNSRQVQGLPSEDINLHLIFSGNAGTGKTTVARILGVLFRETRTLKKGHVVKITHHDLMSSLSNYTAEQVGKKVSEAIDGILYIDNAAGLIDGGESGAQAIKVLFKLMEEQKGRLIVIAAGHKREMDIFIKAYPGLESPFRNTFFFPDFTADELVKIFQHFCQRDQYTLTDEAREKIYHVVKQALAHITKDFGNGKFVHNLYDVTLMNMASRIAHLENPTKDKIITILNTDIPEYESVGTPLLTYEDAIAELNSMIGLQGVKQQVNALINRMLLRKSRQEMGLPSEEISVHLVFTGNPGTGKTTVARILGVILRGMGLLEKGHVVETGPVDLIAAFVGQSAIKTKAKIDEAMGGILFIDEAYGITSGENSFGADVINTLLKLMEDRRDKFVVIAAGYKTEMKDFINANPGLKSRFTNTIEFEDYNRDELLEIFERFIQRDHYHLTSEARRLVANLVDEALLLSKEGFSNGRFMRKVYYLSLENVANRVTQLSHPTKEDLTYILPEDIVPLKVVKETDDEDKKRIGFL